LAWRPGSGKLGQQGENMLTNMTTPTENPEPKTKKSFFQSESEEFPNPQRVWTPLSFMGWQVMELQTLVKKVASAR